MHTHHRTPPAGWVLPPLTLSQILDDLIALADQLGALAHTRDDADLAALATASMTTASTLHVVAKALVTLTGVPDPAREGAP